MDYIFTIGSICAVGFAYFSLFGLVGLVYKIIFKRFRPTIWDTFTFLNRSRVPANVDKVKWSLAALLVLALFLFDSAVFRELVGVHSIEDLNSGTHCYYVEVTQGGKAYTLPGEITIHVDEYGDGDGGTDYVRRYHIERVYFSNGGYLDFSIYGDNYVTNLDDYVHVYDQDEEEWYCKILNEHAYCPEIEETSYVSTSSVVELVFVVAAVIYNWMGYLLWDEKSKLKYDGHQKQRTQK